MKRIMERHKAITGTLVMVAFLLTTLFVVSHTVYHRSFFATVIEIYMTVIDREAMYAAYAQPGYVAYAKAAEDETTVGAKEKRNLPEAHFKPAGVSMDIPYYYDYEHGMQVYHFNEDAESDKLIIYYPGGGYINQPLKYHWKIINKLAQEIGCPILMPVYPKAPDYTCEESYEIVMAFYLDAIKDREFETLVFMGDSSGGGMSLVMSQLLRDNHPEAPQPDEIILLSPWMDVSMDNEEAEAVDPVDPMLDVPGIAVVGQMWAGSKDVHDPMASPIYGTFENLGHISIFASTRDILCPDDVKFSEMLTEQGIDHICVVEEGLNHPYVLFPIPEAKQAQEMIIDIINGNY